MFWLLMATIDEDMEESSIGWESRAIFYFNSIPPCLQQWLPIIAQTSKIQCRMVIPWVLNGNRSLFLNLSQHELQIGSDIWLIINEYLYFKWLWIKFSNHPVAVYLIINLLQSFSNLKKKIDKWYWATLNIYI